jgi:hypothetical protein
MDLSTVDFSLWPPALVFAVIVIYVVAGVLPDVLNTSPRATLSRPLSGPTSTSSQRV